MRRNLYLLVATVMLACGVGLSSGCNTVTGTYYQDWANHYLPQITLSPAERRQQSVIANPDWKQSAKDSILAGQIQRGMYKAQVLASWGRPERRNTWNHPSGTGEQWVYGDTYLYFDTYGLLESWQASY